ncbi:MAG TPA: DNA repair protein RecN, partial [Acidimicrobiia bacterium]
ADADEIDSIVARSRARMSECAEALTEARTEIAAMVGRVVAEHLADLGLASARVEIDLEPVDPGPNGADRPVLLFASDARLEPGPVSAVASGGELSRLVLALRLATKSETTSTLVFDEVDTGIGGSTALAMGAKLRELARHEQVLCVTHLAQVAAHADTHYVVERDDSGVARVRKVTDAERVTEITRMLAGQPESEAGQTAAAELLALASS